MARGRTDEPCAMDHRFCRSLGSWRTTCGLCHLGNCQAAHEESGLWPPHAKFHNAQTILLGLGLGILTVILAYRPTSFSFPRLIEASCAASLYWLSMPFLPPLFPGTTWVDPEFRSSTPRPIGMNPQQLLAIWHHDFGFLSL